MEIRRIQESPAFGRPGLRTDNVGGRVDGGEDVVGSQRKERGARTELIKMSAVHDDLTGEYPQSQRRSLLLWVE